MTCHDSAKRKTSKRDLGVIDVTCYKRRGQERKQSAAQAIGQWLELRMSGTKEPVDS